MKKLLVLILFLFSFNVAFAQNNLKVPANLAKQYKSEIQKIIDKQVPIALKKCNDYEKEARKIYIKALKNPHDLQKLQQSIMDLEDIEAWTDNGPEMGIYIAVINATEKYIKIKDKVPATGYATTVFNFLYPYLKANNISIKQISRVTSYETQKAEYINTMIKHLRSL